jgi:U3 small nucleolar ribonucleoprotein protein LCP5
MVVSRGGVVEIWPVRIGISKVDGQSFQFLDTIMGTDDLPSELNALLETISTAMESTSSALPSSVPSTPNGLSLLDLKNNLLLSYIQNLALLTLSKLSTPNLTLKSSGSQDIIWNLIQDRVHIEKGVLPLETKIGYQIRKLLRSAEESTTPNTTVDESLRFKPNPSALISDTPDVKDPDAVYKPPHISSTTIPVTRSDAPRRNKVLDEFISSSDLNAAPTPLPSIGTNVDGIGARNIFKTSRNADVEKYEEENFIRLPANVGKEKRKGRKERGGMEGLGGEDWSGLDRIGAGKWDFGKKEGRVEKSRKRGLEDGVGGGESVTGREFEKRKKTLQDRGMRKKSRGGKR